MFPKNSKLKRLTNHSEHRVYEQIAEACEEYDAHVYRKIRVADVIDIDQCSKRTSGTYALMAHFDFVVCDDGHMPQFALEFDGAGHANRNDRMKDDICAEADLAIFRVDFMAVGKELQKMSLLRYLVHTWFMAHAFERARQDGIIPIDEPFMMWGFLKPDAKDIFDSEYNFMRKTQFSLERLNRRFEFAKSQHPGSAMSHLSMRHDDGRYAAFACVEAKDRHIYASHKLKLAAPCYGTLAEVPFGSIAIADFNDGLAYENLVQNVELYINGAAHTLASEEDIFAEISCLKSLGFHNLHSGGSGKNALVNFG